MPYTIHELINQKNKDINRLIDLTLSQPGNAGSYRNGDFDPALSPYFSTPFYAMPILAWMKIKEYRPTLAHVRGMEGEVLTERDRFDLTVEEMGSFNVSTGVVWTEADYKLIRELQQIAASAGKGTEAYRAIIDHFLTVPATLTARILRTWLMLACRVATIGKTSYTDPKSGITIEVDYTSKIPAGFLAAAKTGNARWSQLATSTPLVDLADHLNVVYGATPDSGIKTFPEAIAMSRSMADNLRNAAATKLDFARLRGLDTATANLPVPTLEECRTLLAQKLTSTPAASVPELIVTDAIYYSIDIAGTRISSPFIPADYYVFLWRGVVEAARVPTLTSQVLGIPETQGVAIVNKRPENDIPVHGSLLADSAGMILVTDPRFIASRNVENTAIA